MTDQHHRWSGAHYRTVAGYHGYIELECLLCPWSSRTVYEWSPDKYPTLREQQGRAMDHHGRTHSRPAT